MNAFNKYTYSVPGQALSWAPRIEQEKDEDLVLKELTFQLGVIILPDVKLNYKAIVIKTGWHWHKTDIDQCNRIKSSEINPCTCNHFLCDKGAKNTR